MDDERIIELFFARDERALRESEAAYGKYCRAIAKNILDSDEDADEVFNDTLLRAWNTIPPEEPKLLKVYLGTVTRNLSLDRYRKMTAEKRGGCEVSLCLEEAEEFLADTSDEFEKGELSRLLNDFLRLLPERECDIFVRRYFYCDSTAEIARRFGLREANVLVILSRTRKKLKEALRKGGYTL
ncbi:MAG: sigma-70 family RNA polymerase sigma factor [Clostridia bacterium]|nr:sigma-70 family RNA polymerase sigma factor [Clostridia bacterium]